MYGKSLKLLLLSSTMVATLPAWHVANAQQAQGAAPSAIQLDTVTVQGEEIAPGTGPVNGYVATRTTTGMRTDAPITAILQSVSVIGRDEIDDRKALKLDEAIRYSAGVFAAPYGNDPDTDWFFIRGFNATQTGVIMDSLSLASYAFGGFQIDPWMLERIEILKGPSSALYGGSNPGGLVNMISKRPEDRRFGYAEAGINNFGNAYFQFDINDVFGGYLGETTTPGVVKVPIAVGGDPVWAHRVTGRIAGGDYYTDYGEDLRGTIMPQRQRDRARSGDHAGPRRRPHRQHPDDDAGRAGLRLGGLQVRSGLDERRQRRRGRALHRLLVGRQRQHPQGAGRDPVRRRHPLRPGDLGRRQAGRRRARLMVGSGRAPLRHSPRPPFHAGAG